LLWRNLTESSKGYYYNIDELPLYNWVKLTEKREYIYTRKDLKKGTDELDIKAYEILYEDYIATFGLNKLYKKLLEQMKKKALAELDFVITGERFKLTLIELEVKKLEAMLNNNNNETTIEQTLVHISKWVGTWINAKNITVKEYFNLVNEIQNENKTLKNGQKNKP
tara:strand:- start:3734 stop:4234 length:501 start_codon:yes stop_codon:yes gene_type:complete